MRQVRTALKIIWIVALAVTGLLVGANVGYVNGGWVGAIFLGLAGAAVGTAIGAAGSAGLELILGGLK